MTFIWKHTAVLKEPDGDIIEVNFGSKEEMCEYLETCDKEILYLTLNVEEYFLSEPES